jgi:hypothetical protein
MVNWKVIFRIKTIELEITTKMVYSNMLNKKTELFG